MRPKAPRQVIRQSSYVFAAVAPEQGLMTSLILPYADTAMMNLFLEQVARDFAHYFIVMQVDQAGWHRSNELQVPDIIPLIEEKVIGAIQAQQQEIRAQMGRDCPYLFPNPRFSHLPYKETAFAWAINKWAVEKDIRDHNEKLWRFQSHQFRHTVSMRLINEDVPLEVISRLLGHRSLIMTQVYARIKDKKMRADLEPTNCATSC